MVHLRTILGDLLWLLLLIVPLSLNLPVFKPVIAESMPSL